MSHASSTVRATSLEYSVVESKYLSVMPDPTKILVVQPSWVGDAVMATPTLRAIRLLYPQAHISYLMRRYVKGLYGGMPWADQIITHRTGKSHSKTGKGTFDLAARLRTGKFDLAILLPNSFKTALVCKMANIPRIFGYERDGRGFLLTDRLLPTKDRGKFIPSPIIHSYMALARYLGSSSRDLKMELFVTEAERRGADEVFARCGIGFFDRATDRSEMPGSWVRKPRFAVASRGEPGLPPPAANEVDKGPLILLNPGAQYGAAKLWKAEYFAELADRFIEENHATVLISATPKERGIVEAVRSNMRNAAIDLSDKGMTLGSLKEVVGRCDLMVTNDTGPRHIAAAMGVPVVTVFGPTHPEWTEIYYPKERQVAVKVFCGPCQKKICPLDHRCMTRVTPAMVYDASMQLLLPARANETPVGRPLAVLP